MSTCLCRIVDVCHQGTYSDFKNELLFQRFGINYSHIEERFRKGSTLFKKPINDSDDSSKTVFEVNLTHEDIIKDEFWNQHQELLFPPTKSKAAK